MNYVAFPHGRDLLLAFHLFHGHNDRLFPADLSVIQGHWALPLDVFGEDSPALREQIRHTAEQIGAEASFHSHPPDSQPPRQVLSEAIVLRWSRHDMVRQQQSLSGEGFASRRRAGTLWEPSPQNTRYIMAARDRQEAAALFGSLTHYLMQDMEVRPLMLDADGPCPFRYFWLVRGKPPLTLIKRAAQVWWGSSWHSGPFEVFYQWPYVLRTAHRLVQRIPWAEPHSFVLLGPEEPRRLVLRIPDGAYPFARLPEYVELQTGLPQPVVRVLPDRQSPLMLPVRLRLLDRPDPDEFLKQRVRELGDEVAELERMAAAKTRLREELEAADEGARIDPNAGLEPLYVYYDDADAAPRPLRRLLVEWADQEEDLKSLLYRRVDPGSFGRTDLEGRGVAHVLTTASALGRARPSGLGYRLVRYRPTRVDHAGITGTYSLVPAWAKYQLRLFVPHQEHRQSLAIYPALPPSETSAAKLAEALGLPEDRHERNNYCVILEPRGDGLVHACRLAIHWPETDSPDGFRPLADAFTWKCNLDVSCSGGTLARLAHESAAEVRDAILGSFRGAINSSLQTRLDLASSRLRDRVQKAGADLENVAGVVTQAEDHVHQMESSLEELTRAIDEVSQAIVGFTSAGAGRLAAGLDALTAEMARWNALRQRLVAMDRADAERHRKCNVWRRRLRGGPAQENRP